MDIFQEKIGQNNSVIIIKNVQLVGDEYQENNNMDYDKLESRVTSYFNDLDSDGDGKIGANELHQFAEEALKRSLSNSERYTLQAFLDCSCNGYISREDWTKQFCNYNKKCPISW
eukprot:300269_1